MTACEPAPREELSGATCCKQDRRFRLAADCLGTCKTGRTAEQPCADTGRQSAACDLSSVNDLYRNQNHIDKSIHSTCKYRLPMY